MLLQHYQSMTHHYCGVKIMKYKNIKKETEKNVQSLQSDSCRIQTCNLLIRSQMLYSVELRSQKLNLFVFAVAKVVTFLEPTKFLYNFFQKK